MSHEDNKQVIAVMLEMQGSRLQVHEQQQGCQAGDLPVHNVHACHART